MTPKEQNDYFYVCSLIEYIARKTKNKRGTIVNLLGKKGIEKQLYDAEVNHCLSFDQVSDELIEFYNIPVPHAARHSHSPILQFFLTHLQVL